MPDGVVLETGGGVVVPPPEDPPPQPEMTLRVAAKIPAAITSQTRRPMRRRTRHNSGRDRSPNAPNTMLALSGRAWAGTAALCDCPVFTVTVNGTAVDPLTVIEVGLTVQVAFCGAPVQEREMLPVSPPAGVRVRL